MECASGVLCTSCWEKIDDFHKFYCEVKRAHSELGKLDEPVIKVEPLEQPAVDSIKPEGLSDEANNEDNEKTVEIEEEKPIVDQKATIESKEGIVADENVPEHPVKKGRRGRKRKATLPDPMTELESESQSDRATTEETAEQEYVQAEDDSDWEPVRDDDSVEEFKSKKRRRKVEKKPRKKYAPRKPRKAHEERPVNAKTKEDIAKEDEFIRRYCPIYCDKCDFSSDTFGELKIHTTAVHNSNPMVVCCEHKFYKRSFLYQHAQYHENPEKYKCQTCSKVFYSGLALKLHLDYTHVAEEEKIYKCEVCQASFAKAYHLTSHRLKHTSIAEKRFYCQPCDIAFRTNQSYKSHQHSKHGAAAKYVCDICARGFRQKSDLVTHQLSHSEEGLEKLKIQCEHCHKWMKNKKSIWTHRRICQSSGPVACDICGKMAPNPEQLKNHKKFMHQDQRVHQCSYCEKAFKRPIDLKVDFKELPFFLNIQIVNHHDSTFKQEHETIHTGEVLYTCNFCPKTFNSNSNLYSHRRKMHPIEYAEWKLALQLKKQPTQPVTATAETDGIPELPTLLPGVENFV